VTIGCIENKANNTVVIISPELMITSMGGPSALCLCLGKTMMLESRKNETHERLEINYPFRLNLQYF
jgi:hypothetical protein